MQADFFQSQMERLRKVYSPASLNEERVKVLWDRFRLVDNSQFEGAVSYLIGEFTTPALPSVSKFAEAVSMYRPSIRLNSTFPEEFPDNPRAKELADYYAPKIIADMRAVKARLPYNPEQRGELPVNEPLDPIDKSGEWR